METRDILKALCAECGISGCEFEMSDIIRELLPDCDVMQKPGGSIIASFGKKNSGKKIMLDAHIDRIGMNVTYIDDNGFIKCGRIGGTDVRSLPSSAVTVIGRERISAVICTKPPHLSADKELDKDNVWADTGLPAERVRELAAPGDSIIVKSSFRELLGGKVSCAALDNRAGCAALVRCAHILRDEEIGCEVYIVFSSQEETNESGAMTSAFDIAPDEAIVVDVGFAKQDGVKDDVSGSSGSGVIISIAPVLSGKMTDKLISLAKENGIGCDFEVDGGKTGTNADGIAVCRGGIPTAVVSIPVKNMHTQTETAALSDIDDCAELLAQYIREGGIADA